MNQEKIGLFIKNLRKEKGYTQKDIAKKLGVTDRAISKWERGLGCPDVSLLEDLSHILDVSISELLKGERLIDKDVISNQDLINSMYSQKKVTLNLVKVIANYISVISVCFFVLIIVITNLQSINTLYRKYYMDSNHSSSRVKDKYFSYQEKVKLILSQQGKFQSEDYAMIQNYIRIMYARLSNIHHHIYIDKNIYSYRELLQFYIDQQQLFVIEINTIDLYQILLKYNVNVSSHMLNYYQYQNSIHETFMGYANFFVYPYHNYRKSDYDGYYPNVFEFLELIYKKELIICDDIINVGDLK